MNVQSIKRSANRNEIGYLKSHGVKAYCRQCGDKTQSEQLEGGGDEGKDWPRPETQRKMACYPIVPFGPGYKEKGSDEDSEEEGRRTETLRSRNEKGRQTPLTVLSGGQRGGE